MEAACVNLFILRDIPESNHGLEFHVFLENFVST